NLRASLNFVLQNAAPHTMAVQKYDIRRPDGSFEERFWSPLNKPVLDKERNVSFIIHRVEDVTEFVQLRRKEEKQLRLAEEMRGRIQEMEMEIYNRAQEIQEINSRLLEEIRQRKQSQEELRESQIKFSTIFFQSPVMNTIADAATGRYIEVNDNFAKFC